MITTELTDGQKAEIDGMSRISMCRLWRFAPPGHPYFDTTQPFYEYFKKRFDSLGGFSPEISKQIDDDE